MSQISNYEKERRAAIVSNDFRGIIPYNEAFYIYSILYSASRCLESFADYDHLKNADVPPDYLVCLLQEAVGHAAALSRYFWPSPGGKSEGVNQKSLKERRGMKLREAFILNESSPLYNRELRNAWEHFDERLDTYLLENQAGIYFPQSTIKSHSLADDPLGHVFKLLDPDEECLVLLGVKYFFAPVRNEVQRIHASASEAIRNGARLRTNPPV